MGLGVVGRKANGGLVVGQRFRAPVGVDECVPELVGEVGVGGREAEGSFVGRDRVREPARGREGVAKAKVRGGVDRVTGEHGPIVLGGGFSVSGRDQGAGPRRAQLGVVGCPRSAAA